MPAATFIELTVEEDRTLYELSLAEGGARRIKLRAMALRLNADRWTVPDIAQHLQQAPQTVRETLKRWQERGLGGLWEAQGRGGKAKWQAADLEAVETWLEEKRSYTSRQIQQRLQQDRGIDLSCKQIGRILKKRATAGSA